MTTVGSLNPQESQLSSDITFVQIQHCLQKHHVRRGENNTFVLHAENCLVLPETEWE